MQDFSELQNIVGDNGEEIRIIPEWVKKTLEILVVAAIAFLLISFLIFRALQKTFQDF